MKRTQPVDSELTFDTSEIIVSKTDLKGRITYANRTFARIAGYCEAELIGQPHSIIRHPDMPRAVFKLLWDVLEKRDEVFAYVKNLARSGGYYWVFAHVTPSFDNAHNVVGYHSNRRVPRRDVISNVIEPLYAELLAIENSEKNAKSGLQKSYAHLNDIVRSKARSYDELIFSL
ncbi:MAG: PAS domain S-box protein [Rhodobiaceae bacterium]|nr:PAS domain S-box protein [Rhodobiaceae bacterium]MCC0041278.1 PAS domain S-box protein [Rhodobiaceae bacterium]